MIETFICIIRIVLQNSGKIIEKLANFHSWPASKPLMALFMRGSTLRG